VKREEKLWKVLVNRKANLYSVAPSHLGGADLPLTVIVGGFFGDEGKGKVVAYLSLKDRVDIAVRVGSVNAGHTVIINGREYKLRMVPSAFVYGGCRLLIGAGANVNPTILLNEVKMTGCNGRLGVDRQCSIIEEEHVKRDRGDQHLARRVQTTGQGVGPAIEDRVKRVAKVAKDVPELSSFLTDVAFEVHEALKSGKKVVLEGTQGTYLSLYHGTYPFVTGRDTTASAVCSEVGVGPKNVDDVIVVFKAYVTRVGGGPLPGEVPAEEAMAKGWAEVATVTGRLRRAAPFNFELARRAVALNSATMLAVTKLDVLYPKARGVKSYEALPSEAKDFISNIEKEVGVKVGIIGTGPRVDEVIDRRV